MDVARVLLTIAALTGLGGLLRLGGIVSPARAPTLSQVALRVTLPAAIFASLHRFDLGQADLRPAAITFVLTLALWPLAHVTGRLLGLDTRSRALFVMATMFANTAFLGYPVSRALYGEAGFAQAVLIDQLGCEPLAVLVGAVIASHAASGGHVDWWREVKGLLAFPPLVSLVAAFAWNVAGPGPLPSVAIRALELVGAATVPIVCVALGLVMRPSALRPVPGAAAALFVLRLGVAPALALAGAKVLGLSPLLTAVTVIENGMPTMMFTLVLALRAGLSAELAAAFIAATTIGAAASIPFWAWVVG